MTLVRGYLRGWRRQRAEVTVEVGSERRRAWNFLMRLMYSGRDFVRLYDCQDQIAFLDGHVRAFAHFGGVPARIVYDNLAAEAPREESLAKRSAWTRRELAAITSWPKRCQQAA